MVDFAALKGKTPNPVDNPNPASETGAELAPVESEVADTVEKIYTSAPVMSLKLGRFQFTKGVLTLTDSTDIELFDKLLGTLPPRERNAIRTISMEKAIAMVRPQEPGVTKNFDSAVGRQRETVAGQATIGTEALEDSKPAEPDAQA